MSDSKKAKKGWRGAGLRPGFAYGQSERASFPGPLVERARKRFIPLLPSCQPNSDVLTFVVKVAPMEVVKFAPVPIFVSYVAWITNPNYDPNGATDKIKSPKLYAISQTDKETVVNRHYIDPLTQTQALFSHAEITLDGENLSLQMRNQGLYTGFYSAAMKTFMAADERAKFYDIHSCISDQVVRRKLDDPDLTEAFASMHFDVELDPQPRSLKLSFDGIPFLCYPRNFNLARLRGKKEEGVGFSCLPPGTEVVISLHRTKPDYRYIEQVAVPGPLSDTDATVVHKFESDADYFSDATMPNDLVKWNFDIRSVFLLCETLRLHPDAHRHFLAGVKTTPMRWFFDASDTGLQRISPGQKETDVVFSIPKGVALVYVAFTYQSNVHFTEGKKHSCSYRVTVPKSVRSIRFYLSGEEILFENGLQGITSTLADGSVSLEMYTQYLMERGWLDPDYPEVQPRGDKNSYKAFFPLDLSAFDIGQEKELLVHVRFDDGGSDKELIALCTRVMEYELTRSISPSQQRKWTLAPSVR